MKCKYCDGTGTSNWCVNGCFKPCDYCDGTGEVEDKCGGKGVVEPLTNEEWRRTCSTEEFAKFLEDVTNGCYHCGMTDDISQCAFQKHQCNIKEWLKEKYDGRLCEMDSQRV